MYKYSNSMKHFESIPAYFIVLAWFGCIAAAIYLTPNSSGLGTHQQLGLPACWFYYLTKIPCPTCGLTTSYTHLMHGHFTRAFWANAAGPLIFILHGAITYLILFSKKDLSAIFQLSWIKRSAYLIIGLVVIIGIWRLLSYGFLNKL